ncbi:hypothetical protein OPV22_022015 [Ensete ventricosum]|uniref:Uncharacterized protein n=1 Tax=Ensete ventricosum TaxID=4639 RepID=A0AAV8QTI8_ENSVE|nr:hypothetical protein OPV22_022015 [Ensete ventricosum]
MSYLMVSYTGPEPCTVEDLHSEEESLLSHEHFLKLTERIITLTPLIIITLTPLIGVILAALLCASPSSACPKAFHRSSCRCSSSYQCCLHGDSLVGVLLLFSGGTSRFLQMTKMTSKTLYISDFCRSYHIRGAATQGLGGRRKRGKEWSVYLIRSRSMRKQSRAETP